MLTKFYTVVHLKYKIRRMYTRTFTYICMYHVCEIHALRNIQILGVHQPVCIFQRN